MSEGWCNRPVFRLQRPESDICLDDAGKAGGGKTSSDEHEGFKLLGCVFEPQRSQGIYFCCVCLMASDPARIFLDNM